jgi:hypothetical protein
MMAGARNGVHLAAEATAKARTLAEFQIRHGRAVALRQSITDLVQEWEIMIPLDDESPHKTLDHLEQHAIEEMASIDERQQIRRAALADVRSLRDTATALQEQRKALRQNAARMKTVNEALATANSRRETAAWRLARADRLEFGLLIGADPRESPGRALVRDGRAAAAFATLVRYRGGAQAELFRTLKVFKALQAAAARAEAAADATVEGTPEPRPGMAAPRLPAGRPALPPLRERARPRASDAAGARRSRHTADADATPNEPERPGSGRRCASDATRNRPERRLDAEPSGPGGCFLLAAGDR